jgi:hypothetical protein
LFGSLLSWEELANGLFKGLGKLYKTTFLYAFMNRLQEDMLEATLIWWGIKAFILLVLYFIFIYPNLPSENLAIKNFVNIAYGFLSVFVIFAMKGMKVKGLFSFKK